MSPTRCAASSRRAGGPGVPVHRRHRSRQPQLRRRPCRCCAEARAAALALRRGTVGRQRDVFRDRPGQRAVGQCASRRRPADLRGARLCRGAAFEPLLVNTVVGFIGPEYLYDGKQIIRAGLEDHFCGKLLGLPMGCDVCYTNHAEADQDDMDTLLTLLGWPASTSSWACRAPTTSCSTTRAPRSTTRCICAALLGLRRRRSSRPGWTAWASPRQRRSASRHRLAPALAGLI